MPTKEPRVWYYLELIKGKRRWFWHLKSSNGQVVLTSEKYVTKFSAKRSAKRYANRTELEVRIP